VRANKNQAYLSRAVGVWDCMYAKRSPKGPKIKKLQMGFSKIICPHLLTRL